MLLAEELKQRGQIEDIGGYAYLGELWDAAPTAANAEYYARIVRDKALVRNLIHASTEILRDAYDQAQPADELLEEAERKILDVAQMGVTGQTFTLEEALAEAYDRIDTRNTGETDVDQRPLDRLRRPGRDHGRAAELGAGHRRGPAVASEKPPLP